jgi:hypothetical protein
VPGALDFVQARRQQDEMPFGSAATFGNRLADVRTNQATLLETVKCRVDRAWRDFATCGGGNFFANGRTVRALSGAHEAEQDDKFEFTEA